MSSNEENKRKEYEVERFDFAVFVNDFIVCKRNFKINNFIEHSMDTLDFKEFIEDNIVRGIIDNDLKSKSRIYTWAYYDPLYDDNGEFDEPLIEPWECTFKFVIYDGGREVFSTIWDGRYYPRYVRNMVDLSNKLVKFTNKRTGNTYVYDKEKYFTQNEGKLNFEMEVLKKMIWDKPNLLYNIAKCISDKCSTFDPNFRQYDKRQTVERYGDKKYNFNLQDLVKKEEYAWGKKYADKTKAYFKNLY